MSSLEEPLSLESLPKLNGVGRLQRFSSSTDCRPRVDEMEMGNCFIEGRECSSSNSCNEEYAWGRQARAIFRGDSRTSRCGRNRITLDSACDPWSFQEHHYSSSYNDRDNSNLTNKENCASQPQFFLKLIMDPTDFIMMKLGLLQDFHVAQLIDG